MAINRAEIRNLFVFKGEFEVDFCPGINVIIGSNGTGKTTLLRAMYYYPARKLIDCISINYFDDDWDGDCIFIPEKDMLSHSKGLPETVRHGNAQFSQIEVDIIERARVLPSAPEQPLYWKICDIISGEPEHDGQSFYMNRNDVDKPIPFSMEASGYRKFGLLALLIRNEQIKPGSVLFWDEPENSLNPELIPKLVDILLELSRNGVQIFIATHSEILSSYFAVNREKSDSVMFYSLYKDGEVVKSSSNDRFDLLHPNNLTAEPVKLYEKEIEKGLGSND